MKMSTRLIASFVLVAAACFLQREFTEYDVKPLHASAAATDMLSAGDGEIVFLGLTTLAPDPSSDLARFHGRIGAERGIFARKGYNTNSALVGGVVIPILLVLSAAYLLLRRQMK